MLEGKRPEFEHILETFVTELSKLRTNRANPAMIKDIKVDYYGTMTALNQLASITVPDPRQLLVAPWDKNALAGLEKAVREADLGFSPVNEGDKIRITLPELTGERRQELTKLVGRIAEEARVRVRSLREQIFKEIKKQEEEGTIREDERFRQQDKLQDMVEEYNQQIKELAEAKEKEITTI